MPLIAQVAYKVPGANTADWVEIYDRLYREVRCVAQWSRPHPKALLPLAARR